MKETVCTLRIPPDDFRTLQRFNEKMIEKRNNPAWEYDEEARLQLFSMFQESKARQIHCALISKVKVRVVIDEPYPGVGPVFETKIREFDPLEEINEKLQSMPPLSGK